MIKLGIISYSDQDSLYSIAKKCAATIGITVGGAGAVFGAGMGTVTVPGVGAVPGGVAGFLAGLIAGTTTCTAANLKYRRELRSLLDD
jgi:hypothetical protein